MKGRKHMKKLTNIIYSAFALFALAWLALAPDVRAVCQDACLTNNNTVHGEDALISLTTGTDNTAVGFDALFSDTTGWANTAIGSDALHYNTTGVSNTATGVQALVNNTIGFENTANGGDALFLNTTGNDNTAIGFFALFSNSTGFNNTASGEGALESNTGGSNNTATGLDALFSNSGGVQDTATGAFALYFNTTGNFDTANGYQALLNNSAGKYDTATGFQALLNNTTGSNNTAMGRNALKLNTTGNNNTALGNAAGFNLTTGSNNIDIGNVGIAAESNTIRIGGTGSQTNTFIAGISGATVPGGVGVIIDSTGHMGTIVSSERFKNSIKPMDKASEAILALKPVTFRYKHELDPSGIPQFGLVAEQVEKVNPDLVARDNQGRPYTVRYEAVNAMLLNEFLKDHRKVAVQEATITQLKAELQATATRQQKQIEALTAGLQNVSAQLDLSKPAPKTVSNNH
jgi:trimeric autotransporter adhesin